MSSVPVSPNFNRTTPAAPAGHINTKWQVDTVNPADVSTYVPNTGGVDARSTTTEPIHVASLGKLVTFNNAGATAVTPDSTVPSYFWCTVMNLGAGLCTLTPSSGNINGGATAKLPQNATGLLFFDGVNWWLTDVAAWATIAGVQQELYVYAADTGAANAYVVTLTPAPTVVVGSLVVMKAANANTTASTLAVNGGGANPITKSGNTALSGGEIKAGMIVFLVWDGTEWQIIGSSGGGADALVVGFGFGPFSLVVQNNAGPKMLAVKAGTVSRCAIVINASDATTDCTFRIMKNGVNVFSANPTLTHGSATGTTVISTALTSSPLTVAQDDIFQIDVLTGTNQWQFTAQLET